MIIDPLTLLLFSCIQQTYIGVKAVEVLVHNFGGLYEDVYEQVRRGRGRDGDPPHMVKHRVRQEDGLLPIVTVTYTNHALDQFLESLLDAGIENLVRVGGGCKSERLEPYNIRNGKSHP